MRLTVLGGSAAGPNPGQGCSGYLVESGRTQVVLDLGPGTLLELRRHIDFRALDAVVLSHLHLDHMLDVLALRYALTYNPVPPEGRLQIWLPPDGLAFLEKLRVALSNPHDNEDYFSVFDCHEYNPDDVLVVGELRFRFFPTVHYVPCWAIRASNGKDGDLFYTADTGPSADLAADARGSHLVIAEGTERGFTLEAFASRGHLTPFEAGTLAHNAGAAVLVLSHLWGEDDQFSAIDEASSAFAGPIELATPGLRLAWA